MEPDEPDGWSDDDGPKPPRRPDPRGGRPSGPLLPVLLILLVAFIVISWLSGFWATWLWYGSVGFTAVYRTELLTQLGLFVVGLLVAGGLIWSSLAIAYRTRPFVIPRTPAEEVMEQYRRAIEPLRRTASIVIPAFFGILAATTLVAAWKDLLLWMNGGDFGVKDPQFGMDVGFFVFSMPWLETLVGFATMALVMALVAALAAHYVYGGLQLPGRGPSSGAAYIHLGILGALLFLVRGAAYWLDRYAASYHTTELMTGIRYTDDNAVLPGRAVLAMAAVGCALLFLSVVWTRSWRLPIISFVVLVGLSVIIGGIYPALLQSIKVGPSQQSLEAPYIDRNIKATRAAFGIDKVQVTDYAATTNASPATLRSDAQNIPGIRIMDPNVISTSFKQNEAQRSFYTFPDVLDVDRYSIDGKTADAVVAARELNLEGVPAGQRNWLNDHTVYTHGYGVVAAYGNRRSAKGDMVTFMSGFGSTGPDGKPYEPRIYFGEESPTYSIVGSAAGVAPREFDYPSGSGGDAQAKNTYAGTGGVQLSSFARRLAYAITLREPNLLLSDAVNSDSRILDHRTPTERVESVAPWLTLDGNAYPAVVDGKVLWILDGYTTSATYPNSRLTDLKDATSDSVTETSAAVTSLANGQINYIRNSVKATVDAYSGAVTLYAWDESDPVLRAWMRTFPGAVRPLTEMSGDLMTHVRYPQDLLKIQRVVLARYHITDPSAFYSGNDVWAVPKDPTHDTQDQPTYYQSISMPGQDAPAFSLTSTFVPAGTGPQILRGFLAADGDAGSSSGQRSDGYGSLRLLALPPNSTVAGPSQVENKIESATVASQNPEQRLDLRAFINQNRGSGATFTFGNLLTLPVGGGLLYVQPLYVQQAKTGGSSPLNVATVAVFGDKIGWGDTLGQALDGVFGTTDGGGVDTGTDPGTTTPPSTGGGGTTDSLAAAIARAQAAYDDGQKALKAGDFTAYGEAQKRLEAALTDIAKLAPKPTSTPTGTPSPTTSAGG